MTWKVVLVDEKNKAIGAVDREFDLPQQTNPGNLNERLRLLKYLDPYGDTCFNAVQINDVIEDLNTLISNGVEDDTIRKIIALALRCKNEPHTYLVFYGD